MTPVRHWRLYKHSHWETECFCCSTSNERANLVSQWSSEPVGRRPGPLTKAMPSAEREMMPSVHLLYALSLHPLPLKRINVLALKREPPLDLPLFFLKRKKKRLLCLSFLGAKAVIRENVMQLQFFFFGSSFACFKLISNVLITSPILTASAAPLHYYDSSSRGTVHY